MEAATLALAIHRWENKSTGDYETTQGHRAHQWQGWDSDLDRLAQAHSPSH